MDGPRAEGLSRGGGGRPSGARAKVARTFGPRPALSEYLRVVFGVKRIGMAETIYGLLLVLFIIFLPAGMYGSARDLRVRRRGRAPAPATG